MFIKAAARAALLETVPLMRAGFGGNLQAHDSAAKQEEETAWEAERHESKYARTLEQLPAIKTVT